MNTENQYTSNQIFTIGQRVWIHRTDGSKRDGYIEGIKMHPNPPHTLYVTLPDGSWIDVSEAEVTPFENHFDDSDHLTKIKDLCVEKNLHLCISPDATFQVWSDISDEMFVAETTSEAIELIECLAKLEKWREKF